MNLVEQLFVPRIPPSEQRRRLKVDEQRAKSLEGFRKSLPDLKRSCSAYPAFKKKVEGWVEEWTDMAVEHEAQAVEWEADHRRLRIGSCLALLVVEWMVVQVGIWTDPALGWLAFLLPCMFAVSAFFMALFLRDSFALLQGYVKATRKAAQHCFDLAAIYREALADPSLPN